jgi:hypothetical protein
MRLSNLLSTLPPALLFPPDLLTPAEASVVIEQQISGAEPKLASKYPKS